MRKTLLFLLLLTLAPSPCMAESVYERVMKSGEIRCGYNLWSIFLDQNPNTGELSGIFYDYMSELGKNLGLKIVWAEEMGDETNIAALENGRVDAFCNILFWNAQRARQADFTTPLFYMGTEAFVRADDNRFDNNLDRLNRPDVTFTAIDGDIFARIAQQDFPDAKLLSLPQLSNEADMFLSVVTGKADVTLTEPYSALAFMASNPGKIKRVPLPKALRYSPVSIMIKGGEDRFRRLIDVATTEMHGNGAIDRIIDKHEKHKGSIYKISKPYAVAE